MPSPVLSQILESIRRHRHERPVVLFDLDGTLYDNRPRTLRILHAFAAQLENEHAHDAHTIRGISYRDLDYRLDDTLAARGIATSVIERAVAAWELRFFTDAACSDDIPVSGSVHFVRACWDAGATVVYLTGRDIPGMLLGTSRTLRDDGFPLAIPRVELVMKPTFEEGDSEFKERLLETLGDLGRVVASFDNEPANCNLFRARWPDAVTVLLDTQRAPGAPPLDPHVAVIANFDM
jgi:hypothetical protein